MKSAARPPLLLACAATVTLALTACHATVDARWATTDDTVYHWQKAMPSLPIEVRGQLPNASSEQIARAIPNASAAPSIESAPRLVVELGNDASPRGDTYCAKSGQDQASAAPGTALGVTLTLCDGTRLVASSHSPLDAKQATVADLPHQIDRLKKLTLIGIARSPAQYTETNG
ncbi:hypothetical protein [Dyella sp. RRB7]|uniref:hypothetical protein n=1 Tax=Dyella sp. RRB7 TaxID=2919502 RepID=UPI001FAA179B|nr:hypothetical protein [Dyella sp. RRB7]